MVHPRKLALFAATACITFSAGAQVTSFDALTGVVSIPSVSIGTDTYARVTLLYQADGLFALGNAEVQLPASPGVARFDLNTGVLLIPAVRVGDATYLDVTLRLQGDYRFSLQDAVPLPPATLAAVKAFMAAYDAQWASAAPSTGNARVAMFDNCYRADGRTRAYLQADTDADLPGYRSLEAYQVGRSSGNLQVLAVRNLRNANGSTRQEIDLQYDISYKDGSKAVAVLNTLISGSSSGTAGCGSVQDGAALRFYGNQHLVEVNVRARNVREVRRSRTSGAALSPAVNYRRTLEWQVSDPLGNASYVVVTGPGPSNTLGGVARPFSLKLLSPRVLRSAPELMGKPGNYLNWLDDDNWRICRSSDGGVPVAELANCVGQGTGGMEWGVTASTPNASADQNFVNQGWVAGGVYRFDVYNDDGWKTVNGHAGRQPLATYFDTLEQLPYKFVDMIGSSGVDKFPKLNFGGLSNGQVAANANSATPASMSLTWNALGPLPDQRRFGLYEGWSYQQGPKLGNLAAAATPGYRSILYLFPGSQATGLTPWPVAAKPSGQGSITYFEFSLLYVDRNDNQILNIESFQ